MKWKKVVNYYRVLSPSGWMGMPEPVERGADAIDVFGQSGVHCFAERIRESVDPIELQYWTTCQESAERTAKQKGLE